VNDRDILKGRFLNLMKRLLIFVFAAAVAVSSVDLFAGSVDNLINQSVSGVRTYSRNAATDSADAVTYNPAGTVRMKDGLYVNLSNQFMLKNYEMDVQIEDQSKNVQEYDTALKSEEPSILVPNLYMVYKQNDWAAFCALNVPAGGGGVDYDKGVPFFVKLPKLYELELKEGTSHFKASSMYLAGVMGGAYSINKYVSVSLSGRYVYGKRKYDGGATFTDGTPESEVDHVLDAKRSAHGFGGIVGVDVTPFEGLNIGMRYETETILKWKTKINNMTLPDKSSAVFGGLPIGTLLQFQDGYEEKTNLPSVFAFGVSYDITKDLSVSTSLTYYFIKLADTSDDIKKTAAEGGGVVNTDLGYDDDYGNGFDLGCAVEYRLFPDLLVSLGYNYTHTGANEDTYSDFEFALDCHTVAFGGKYSVMENLDVSLGFSGSFYTDGDVPWPDVMELGGGKEVFSKSVFVIAVGAEYKVL